MNYTKKLSALAAFVLCAAGFAQSGQPIILTETAVANLRIETVQARPADFTESIFSIGRVESIPANKSVLSSRVPGRIVSIEAHEGDRVEAGQAIVEIESLLAGDPPPVIPLRAPLPGMVMESHTHLGKPVVPETELFEIVDLSKVYAVARLPEDHVGEIPLHSTARITVPALPDQSFQGTLSRYGTTANTQSGTLDAYFALENPDYRLRPNMRVEFSIATQTRPNTLSVPKDSIQTDGVDHFVFVEDFDLENAYQKVPVLTGTRNDTHVEILRGLFPGDKVVTRGSYALMFAGSGTISLKEALDAAHGHEHNEDGSELTAEQKRQRALEKQASTGGGSVAQTSLVWFLSILSFTLLVLLILSLTLRRKANA